MIYWTLQILRLWILLLHSSRLSRVKRRDNPFARMVYRPPHGGAVVRLPEYLHMLLLALQFVEIVAGQGGQRL